MIRKYIASYAAGVVCATVFLVVCSGKIPSFTGLTSLDLAVSGGVCLLLGWTAWLGERKSFPGNPDSRDRAGY